MSAVVTAAAQKAADALPPLTDEQCLKVAALLSLAPPQKEPS